uniref:alpha-1,2-Mannosidase n=1 Tax=Acrobeloides nanus TaxID=290746 RepID=A0A914CQ79_9BILA
MYALKNWYLFLFILFVLCTSLVISFTDERIAFYREKVRSMFYHAYNGYLENAFPLDELNPLTCAGMDTWGSFSLTLIDALDTLLIMGNETEFKRAVEIVLKQVNVDANVNVSVFETNIRVVGGLLSAHMLSGKVKGMALDKGWPCSGPLLTLAERFVQKLLPAFNSETGMPYGTVNLRYGVNRFETPVTCTAGVGTFILEFGTLSRLTGNPLYERVALKALEGLWKSRSAIGLVGNHINIQNGVWTATDAGIGAGVDSYFEYLVKGGILFQRPLLLRQFYDYEEAINKHIRKDDWFLWVSMTKGQVTFPYFQSLEAFWPGVLALLGDVDDAARIMLTYNQVVRQYGFAPEFYNLPNQEAVDKRSGYPLRPEIIESLMYLYRATDDPTYLQIGAGLVEAIDHSCKTKCGYATIRDVIDHSQEDRMESFFLAETTKYLYLLFDPENFIHNDGSQARIIDTPNGECAIEAGGYIFNTEAHPIDPAIMYCCSAKRHKDVEMLQKFEDSISFISLLDLNDPYLFDLDKNVSETTLANEFKELEQYDIDKEFAYGYEKDWRSEENRSNKPSPSRWIDTPTEDEERENEIQTHNNQVNPHDGQQLHEEHTKVEKSSDVEEENQTDGTTHHSKVELVKSPDEENKKTTDLHNSEEELQTEEETSERHKKLSEENANNDEGNAKTSTFEKHEAYEVKDSLDEFKEKLAKSIKDYTESKSVPSVNNFVEAVSVDEPVQIVFETKPGELFEREEINKQVQEMITKAKIFDEKTKAHGSTESNLAAELTDFLSQIKEEYTSLIETSEKLQISPSVQEIKIKVAKRKYVKDMPVVEALCDDCCVPLDKRSDSVALRRMLNVIYSKHIYQNLGIHFVQGPICRPKKEPSIESSYMNEIPDIDELESIDQSLDAIENFAFSTFRYRELAEEGYTMLTFPSRSFASIFTGLGQVALARENSTRGF